MPESTPLPLTLELGDKSVEVLLDRFVGSAIREGSYSLHEHAVYELCLVEAGALTLEVDGEPILLESGESCLIPAMCPHRILECSKLQRFNLRFRFRSGVTALEAGRLAFDAELLRLAAAIRESANPTAPLELCRLKANLTLLFCNLLERSSDPRGGTRKLGREAGRLTLYAEIDTFLVDNCARNLTVGDLAERLGYSKMQTHRIVTECCGMPFSRKLREIRIRRATELLTMTSLTLSEIAERCGYSTRSGFESAYLREVGVRPAKVRRK